MNNQFKWRSRFRRLFGTIAHLTYESRRPEYKYENLANNGYIYRWAARLLIRWKAREWSKIKPVGRKMNYDKFRGYEIEMRSCGTFYYVDNGEKVADTWTVRPCGHCGKHNSSEGYDGCIGEIPGAMNACCGHGNVEEAYVQYSESVRYTGEDASKILEIYKE